MNRTFVDLLDQRAERLGERDAALEQRRHLARERRDLGLLDAAEAGRRDRRRVDRPPFFAFCSFAALPPFDSSKLVTSTPSLRRIWRSAFGDSASRTPLTDLPLCATPLNAYIGMSQSLSAVISMTSSGVVMPSTTLRAPSKRSDTMPASTAALRIAPASAFSSASRRTGSLTINSS